jgi:hypothetical protein
VTDQELRALIRESIAKHLGPATGSAPEPLSESGAVRAHASHVLLPLTSGGDADGACLIEPAVRCVHCGYCLSYGH